MTASVKRTNANADEHRREIATAINEMLQGRLNNTGALTILSGSTSTVVLDPRAYIASVPLLMPTNATAAALNPYVTARGLGTFTLTHSAPGADATFLYVLQG